MIETTEPPEFHFIEIPTPAWVVTIPKGGNLVMHYEHLTWYQRTAMKILLQWDVQPFGGKR